MICVFFSADLRYLREKISEDDPVIKATTSSGNISQKEYNLWEHTRGCKMQRAKNPS
jgi:hypothetical protein